MGQVYIHSEKVIHRDVKPANMILTKLDQFPPHLLLADFGIATAPQLRKRLANFGIHFLTALGFRGVQAGCTCSILATQTEEW